MGASVFEEGGPAGRRVAKVTQVLERTNKTVTGVLERKHPPLWVRHDDGKPPCPLQVLTKRRGVRAGERAAVAMTNFGGGKTVPMGTLQERFGPADRRESAVEAILSTHDIERAFPPAVLAEVERVPQAVEPSALAGRLDLRDKTIITIDGASSKEFYVAWGLGGGGQGRQGVRELRGGVLAEPELPPPQPASRPKDRAPVRSRETSFFMVHFSFSF